MADVFISYARVERDEAERIKARLEAMGLSVFLDIDGLDGGDVFSEKLDREVKSAGCVLGLWSPTSLTRPWVQIECDIGKRRGVLLPVAIRRFRDLDVPAQFWNVQFVDLTEASDSAEDPAWMKLRRSLARTLNRPDIAPPRSNLPPPAMEPVRSSRQPKRTTQKPTGGNGGWIAAAGAVLILAASAAVLITFDPLGWRTPPPASPPSSPTSTGASSIPAAAPPPAAATPATAASVLASDPAPSPSASPATPEPTVSPQTRPKDTAALTLTLERTFRPGGPAQASTFSPDGRQVFTVLDSGEVAIWDPRNGVQVGSIPAADKPGAGSIRFLADGKRLLIGSTRLWDIPAQKETWRFSMPQWGYAAVSPDGALMVTSIQADSADKDIHLIDTRTMKEIRKFTGHTISPDAFAFSADGRRLASVSIDNTLRIWDVSSGAQVAMANAHPEAMPSISNASNRMAWPLFSPDGRTVAVSLNDFKGRAAVLLWDAETGKAAGALKYPTGSVGPLAWSKDGSRLAVATTDDIVTIWDPKTQRKLGAAKRLSYMSQKTRSLDFSPDGSHLVGSTDFGTAPLWRIDASAAN